MTNTQIADLAVSDPVVIQAHSKLVNGVPQPPAPGVLKALAEGELQNELNALLSDPAIRSHVMERTGSFTITGNTTAEGRGDILTLTTNVGSVVSVVSSDSLLPIRKIANKEDFDYWYGERYNSETQPDDPQVWVPWDPSAAGIPQILLSPGAGSASTIKISYVRKVNQPVQSSILPDDMHFLIVCGLKARMAASAYLPTYERERMHVIKRLSRIVGGTSAMRLSEEDRQNNLRLSSMTGGLSGSWRDADHARPY